MKLNRQLLQRLLDTWKKIKELRRTNGYTTTSVRLIIKQFVLICFSFLFLLNESIRTSGRKPKLYEQMQQQIEEEIEDEIALADEKYQREKEAYAQITQNRKLQGIRKVDSIFVFIEFNFVCQYRKKQKNV
jgi:hypothetical protein